MIVEKNINKFYLIFLIGHLIIWTLIPSLTNVNLPLDTIEALAWGSNLSWGFNKHPPLSAVSVEIFYQLFGNQDWAFYFLSQVFVISSFIVVFKLAKEFFNNLNLAFISLILLEGIFFFNFTTPEFNVNVAQLPFWALSVYFSWRCIKEGKLLNYIFLGICVGLGILAKYLFLYLIIGIVFLFSYLIFFKRKKIKIYNLITAFLVSSIVISPHIFWLVENDFATISYGIQRAGGDNELINHFFHPFTFILKQIGILIPFFVMVLLLMKKIKIQKNYVNEKIIFLFFTCIIPILFIILTSLIMGAKIRTMWMTPFYLFLGILFIEFFKKLITFKKIKKFYFVFISIFFLSPITYATISLSNEFKRTDYPGREIARLVQNKWDQNFRNEIKIVIGDEWYAGNLSYHLSSRPKWIIELKEKGEEFNKDEGIIYTGNPKILKKICPGVFGTIRPVGYCMIGVK